VHLFEKNEFISFWEQIIQGKGEDTVTKDYKSFINTLHLFLFV